MRLKELLNAINLEEAKQTRELLRKSVKAAIPDMNIYKYLDNNSHPYMSYRFGVALAGSPENEMTPRGPIGSNFTIVGYTDADDEIRKGAERNLGIKSSKGTSHKSKEVDDVNKTSPVAKPKRNQYGI